MVKHFTCNEADAGSTPADILYVALNYFILTIYNLVLNKNIPKNPSERCSIFPYS
jgi:hypothetical protein